jgi:mono/diheme cytochrome c family protein
MGRPTTKAKYRAAVLGPFVLLFLAAGQTAARGDAEAGAEVYKEQNCRECHGDAGKGDGYILSMLKVKVQMRDWTDKAAMAGLTDEYLAEITAKGGEALGKSEDMLKYADKLNEQQIKDLVAFIRSLAH